MVKDHPLDDLLKKEIEWLRNEKKKPMKKLEKPKEIIEHEEKMKQDKEN